MNICPVLEHFRKQHNGHSKNRYNKKTFPKVCDHLFMIVPAMAHAMMLMSAGIHLIVMHMMMLFHSRLIMAA
jgi:hypothetical protein